MKKATREKLKAKKFHKETTKYTKGLEGRSSRVFHVTGRYDCNKILAISPKSSKCFFYTLGLHKELRKGFERPCDLFKCSPPNS